MNRATCQSQFEAITTNMHEWLAHNIQLKVTLTCRTLKCHISRLHVSFILRGSWVQSWTHRPDNLSFFMVLFGPSGQVLGYYFILRHNCFPPHPCQFMTHMIQYLPHSSLSQRLDHNMILS